MLETNEIIQSVSIAPPFLHRSYNTGQGMSRNAKTLLVHPHLLKKFTKKSLLIKLFTDYTHIQTVSSKGSKTQPIDLYSDDYNYIWYGTERPVSFAKLCGNFLDTDDKIVHKGSIDSINSMALNKKQRTLLQKRIISIKLNRAPDWRPVVYFQQFLETEFSRVNSDLVQQLNFDDPIVKKLFLRHFTTRTRNLIVSETFVWKAIEQFLPFVPSLLTDEQMFQLFRPSGTNAEKLMEIVRPLPFDAWIQEHNIVISFSLAPSSNIFRLLVTQKFSTLSFHQLQATHYSQLKTEIQRTKCLPLNLGLAIFKHFPRLWGRHYRLKHHYCVRLCINLLLTNEIKTLLKLARQYLDKYCSRICVRGWTLDQLKLTKKVLGDKIKIPVYKQVQQSIRHYIYFPLFRENGDIIYPLIGELHPYTDVCVWLMNPNTSLPSFKIFQITKQEKEKFVRMLLSCIEKNICGFPVTCFLCGQQCVVHDRLSYTFTKLCGSTECEALVHHNCFRSSNIYKRIRNLKMHPGCQNVERYECQFCQSTLYPFSWHIPKYIDENHKLWCQYCHTLVTEFATDRCCSSCFSAKNHEKAEVACPGCKNGVLKNQGCNSMQCRCSLSFCFGCGSSSLLCAINNGYSPCQLHRK